MPEIKINQPKTEEVAVKEELKVETKPQPAPKKTEKVKFEGNELIPSNWSIKATDSDLIECYCTATAKKFVGTHKEFNEKLRAK
jgi:hypothetical protein